MQFEPFLDPQNDVAFRKIFGSKEHKNLLISFLNEILEKKSKDRIQDVKFLSPYQKPEVAARKESILDVLCTDEKGVQYIVEMQVGNNDHFIHRAQYYAAKAYCSQMCAGERYEHLKEVIFLSLTNFVLFPKKKAYKSLHVVLDSKTADHDLKGFSFAFVELPKFKKTFKDLKTEEDRWLFYFKNSKKPKEFDQLLKSSSPTIQEACEVIKRFNWSDQELIAYEKVKKRDLDNLTHEDTLRREGKAEGLAQGKAEGLAQGKAEGLAQGKTQGQLLAAQNALRKGLSLKDVAEISGLDVAELKAIKKKLG